MSSAPPNRIHTLLCATLGLSFVSAAVPANAQGIKTCSGLGHLTGVYRYVGGVGEERAQHRAVDAAIADMNFLFRKIARSRLLDTNPIPKAIQISCSNNRIATELDGRSYSASLSGATETVTGITGDPLQLETRFTKGRLTLMFRGDAGGKELAFSRSDDGTLRVLTRVFSPRLPNDVIYALTYVFLR